MVQQSVWPVDAGVVIEESTVGSTLRDAAADAPDAIALTIGTADASADRTWTYAELLGEAERCARALLTTFDPGDHIAIWAHNVAEWVILEYGAGLAGMVLVTVNPALRAEEVDYVLRQSHAVGVFHVAAFRDQSLSAIASAIAPDLEALRTVVCLDDWDEFMAAGDGSETELPAVTPDDPVQIQYTSGTTGFPKGARLTHRGITNNARICVPFMGGMGGTMVVGMPLFHTGGCVLGVLVAAAKRANLVLLEQFDPAAALALIERYRADYVAGVPTMLLAMIDHPDFATADVSTLRTVISGGSMVPPELVRTIETRLGVSFGIVYGQTELSPLVTMTRPDDSTERKGTTVGKPLPGVELKVIDPGSGEIVATDVDGEICARGYNQMIDYFDMPERTAETVDAQGWLHTGDLGTMDPEGYVRITGRLKDMIIRGGENIFPAEIENRLFEHPSVADVAVIGVPDERWGEQVAAVIRPADPAAGIDVAALVEHCREHLAPHKLPRQWFTTEAFPLTGSGKVQKFALVDQAVGGELTPTT